VTNRDDVDKILYTPTEAARALGISRSTIYVLMANDEIPSVRIGSCRRLPVDGRRRYVAKLAHKDAAPSARTDGRQAKPQLWS